MIKTCLWFLFLLTLIFNISIGYANTQPSAQNVTAVVPASPKCLQSNATNVQTAINQLDGCSGGGPSSNYWQLNNVGISTTNNVGVGTYNPSGMLQVYSNNGSPLAEFSNNASTMEVDNFTNLHFTGANQLGLYFDTDVSQYALSTQGAQPTYITSGEGNNSSGNIDIIPGGNGNIGIGTFLPNYYLDATTHQMQIGSIHSANPIFNVTSQYGQTFDPTGSGSLVYFTYPSRQVGINTVPGEQLDVNGTIRMTGFNLSTSPVSSYVLTSDSSGNGTWQYATNYVSPPSNSCSNCIVGQYSADSSYIYICQATNTWLRTSIATWGTCGGNLTFLNNNLQFQGSLLTFKGD